VESVKIPVSKMAAINRVQYHPPPPISFCEGPRTIQKLKDVVVQILELPLYIPSFLDVRSQPIHVCCFHKVYFVQCIFIFCMHICNNIFFVAVYSKKYESTFNELFNTFKYYSLNSLLLLSAFLPQCIEYNLILIFGTGPSRNNT
jgi:hypothetical protein